MTATDRPRRRRLLLIGATATVVVAVAVVALAADRTGEVRALPPLPATSRADVDLVVAARRDGGDLAISVVVGVADTAGAGLRLVDWSGAAAGGWPGPDLWDADAAPGWWWSPALRRERLPDGQVVLHLGTGRPDGDEDLLRMVAPVDHVRTVDPGREVEADVRTEAVRVSVVRVCVWAAGTDPDDPGDRPVACADDRVARGR